MSPQPEQKRQHIKPNWQEDVRGSVLIDTVFTASELNVRLAVGHTLDLLSEFQVAPDFQFTIEIVLAELLNNIVEHGYSGKDGGDIHLKATIFGECIRIETKDYGVAMPGLKAPRPPKPNLDVCRQDLPEGQFGWFMIRKLSEDLEYKRIDAENHLSLTIVQ